MAEIRIINQTVDLDGLLIPALIPGTLCGGEAMAHKFVISATRNGTPVALSGTVSGVCLRFADNASVALTGAIESGKAAVTLPATCYALDGRVRITIFVTADGATVASWSCDTHVRLSETDQAVDPGTIIPSISALISDIDAAVASIPADYSDLLAAIAPNYTDLTFPIKAGQNCWYDGDFYRAKVDIDTSENWTSAHWETAVLSEDVDEGIAELKSATSATALLLDNRTLLSETDLSKLTDIRKGFFINSSGRYGASENSVAGRGSTYSPYVYKGSTITVNTGYKCNYSILTIPIPASGNPTSNQKLEVEQNVAAGTTITITHDGYLGISAKYADDSAISDSVTADEFMAAAVTVNLLASTVKDKLIALEQREDDDAFKHITNARALQWKFGKFSEPGSKTYSTDGLMLFDYLHVQAGTKITPASGVECQYRFFPDATGTAAYTSWTGSEKTFNESGKLLMSARYSDTTVKVENSAILDKLTIDIVFTLDDAPVEDVFSRPLSMMGYVPVWDYVGQHTDATGFGQTTEYDDALAVWRALPTAAPDYITETDLGEIEAIGKHTYRYDITPPIQGRSGKTYPNVVLITSAHGHEKSATYGLYYLIKDMLDHSKDDPVLFYLRNFVKFTILPMVNPYGWDATSALGTHGGIRYNENSVNINRNYGTSTWHDFDDDTDYTTPGYNYRGASPFSEEETQRIRDQIIANAGKDCLIIDLHTNGTDTSSAADITFVSVANLGGESFAKATQAADQYMCANKLHMDNIYDVNIGNNVMYGTQNNTTSPGLTCKDWVADGPRTVGATLEVPPGSTTGYLGTHLAKYTPDLIKLCGEMIGNYIVKVLYNLGMIK